MTATEHGVDRELELDLYRRMHLIRGFEDLVQSLFLRGEVYGTTHLYSGQEAVAVGFASVLEDRDRVAATYRGHGHALALGVDPQALLDEMLGRATGINGGRAGSMNVTSPKDRLIGSFGIVGGSIAAATGAAAVTPKVSSNCFTNSLSSRRVISLKASSSSSVLSFAMVAFPSVSAGRTGARPGWWCLRPRLRRSRLGPWTGRRHRRCTRDHIRASG